MKFLFDTNICVYLIRQRHAAPIRTHMAKYPVGSFGLSMLTVAELQFGIAKSLNPASDKEALLEFMAPFSMVPFGERAAEVYGSLRAALERTGRGIGPIDTLIAAHVLSLNLILVTNNEKEFCRVPGLHVENWTKP